MRITQGAFSFLPDLTDEQITAQVKYCLDHSWAVAIEHTDDAHPRNVYWDMWDLPFFDCGDPSIVMTEVAACRAAFPARYIKVAAYDRSYGRQTTALSFLVNRPDPEPGFRLERHEQSDRRIRYALQPLGVAEPPTHVRRATQPNRNTDRDS